MSKDLRSMLNEHYTEAEKKLKDAADQVKDNNRDALKEALTEHLKGQKEF